MYPSISLACAVDNETLIGKIYEEDEDNPLYEFFGEIILESQDVYKPAITYMGLPSEQDVLANIDQFID